jgi:hypothetical protein
MISGERQGYIGRDVNGIGGVRYRGELGLLGTLAWHESIFIYLPVIRILLSSSLAEVEPVGCPIKPNSPRTR